MESFGKIAYEAYGRNREWKTFDGRPMPTWIGLTAEIQAAWEAAAAAVLEVAEPPKESEL